MAFLVRLGVREWVGIACGMKCALCASAGRKWLFAGNGRRRWAGLLFASPVFGGGWHKKTAHAAGGLFQSSVSHGGSAPNRT